MFCFRSAHYRTIAELEGKLAVALAENKDLKVKNEALEAHKQEITDWLLELQGAPSVYGSRANARDKTPPAQPNPFNSAQRASDWSRIAENLENQGFSAGEALRN